jgi:outer membrane lipoprotein-sorting protein
MTRSRALLAAAALFLPLTSLAATADEVMAKLERALSSFEDQTIEFTVENRKAGRQSSDSMAFRTLVKGPMSFTEFLAPGDLKGTRVLATSPTQMWVYLPEFGRVRKVASHSLEQGFMGTTLTQQDMAVPAYSTLFNVAVDPAKAEDAANWYLVLTAKEGVDVSYRTMKMAVQKDITMPVRIEYLNAEGVVVRTETRGNYTCDQGGVRYCMFGFMRMVDHSRGDAWTELRPSKVQLNTGLDEEMFSQRYLQTGF